MMKTYMNYRKNRRLVKYFFALKKMVYKEIKMYRVRDRPN